MSIVKIGRACQGLKSQNMKGLSSYRRAAKVMDLSKYKRVVKISKTCQIIKGLSIHEVFVNTNMEWLSI